jgi:hypothetical protein
MTNPEPACPTLKGGGEHETLNPVASTPLSHRHSRTLIIELFTWNTKPGNRNLKH